MSSTTKALVVVWLIISYIAVAGVSYYFGKSSSSAGQSQTSSQPIQDQGLGIPTPSIANQQLPQPGQNPNQPPQTNPALNPQTQTPQSGAQQGLDLNPSPAF